LAYDATADKVVVPVKFVVEPDRIAQLDLPSGRDLDDMMGDLVRRGLRVRLESSNLLTGQQHLAIDVYPGMPSAKLEKQGDAYVVPVQGDASGDIVASAGALMSRLNAIPFEQIGENLNHTLAGLNALTNDSQLKQSVVSLQATLTSVQSLVTNLNHGLEPALQRLPAIASGLEDAVKRADRLVGSAEAGYGANSQFSRDTSRLLVQLSDAARSIRVLADLLTRHPEALIRGRAGQGTP
jgi:paraquat-inducible protein B